jgi:hypothetical protein
MTIELPEFEEDGMTVNMLTDGGIVSLDRNPPEGANHRKVQRWEYLVLAEALDSLPGIDAAAGYLERLEAAVIALREIKNPPPPPPDPAEVLKASIDAETDAVLTDADELEQARVSAWADQLAAGGDDASWAKFKALQACWSSGEVKYVGYESLVGEGWPEGVDAETYVRGDVAYRLTPRAPEEDADPEPDPEPEPEVPQRTAMHDMLEKAIGIGT